jgi:hypothetical protein
MGVRELAEAVLLFVFGSIVIVLVVVGVGPILAGRSWT